MYGVQEIFLNDEQTTFLSMVQKCMNIFAPFFGSDRSSLRYDATIHVRINSCSKSQ